MVFVQFEHGERRPHFRHRRVHCRFVGEGHGGDGVKGRRLVRPTGDPFGHLRAFQVFANALADQGHVFGEVIIHVEMGVVTHRIENLD